MDLHSKWEMIGSAVWVPRLWLALCNLAVPPITSQCAATTSLNFTFLSQFWINPQIVRDESTFLKYYQSQCVFFVFLIPSGVPHVKKWRTPEDGTDRLCWPSLHVLPPPYPLSAPPLRPLNDWSHARRVCKHRYSQTYAQAACLFSLMVPYLCAYK